MKASTMPTLNSNMALLLIDVQKGFHDPIWGVRNNPNAEENISALLQSFRKALLPIIHIQHLSVDAKSPLRPGQVGAEFIEETKPHLGERVFQKSVNSAFIGTGLDKYLKGQCLKTLWMVGFTTDHCVSTSARVAANLGYKVKIISDAIATFERIGPNGTMLSADLIHHISLASLAGEFATIYDTKSTLEALISETEKEPEFAGGR